MVSGLTEEDNEIIRAAYQVMFQKKSIDQPCKYAFSKNDHIKTKLRKKPSSPCQACESPEHWNQECPDWDSFLLLQQKSAKVGEALTEDETMEQAY